MVVFNWNICFIFFVLIGRKGSARDAHVLDQALTNTNLNFPNRFQGMFYCLARNYFHIFFLA